MSRFCKFFRWTTVEPALCLYMLTTFLKTPVFQNLIYEKVCMNAYHDLALCTNVSAYYEDKYIQSESNKIYFYSSLCLVIPSIFVGLVLGALSDFWSIKIPMLIPYVGLILNTVNYIVQSAYPAWSVYYLLISDLLFGFCGGFTSIIATSLAYGVKNTPSEYKSYRIAAMEGSIGLGGVIGYGLSGTLRELIGYTYVFLVQLVLQCVAFLYVLVATHDVDNVFANDSVEERQQQASLVKRCLLHTRVVLAEFLELLSSPRPQRTAIWMSLIGLGVELFLFAGTSDIQYSYLRYRLGWQDKEYGWFSGVNSALGTVSVLLLYPLLRRKGCSDGVLGCIGVTTKMLSLLCLAILSSLPWAIAAVALAALNRFISTGYRSFIAGLIAQQEQGRMFSVISFLEGVTSLLATAVYNNLYPLSLPVLPGLAFYATAALLIIPFAMLLISEIRMRKHRLLQEQHSLNE